MSRQPVSKEIMQTNRGSVTRRKEMASLDPECPYLVAFSVYNTKPMHFLSMACTSLKWTENEK